MGFLSEKAGVKRVRVLCCVRRHTPLSPSRPFIVLYHCYFCSCVFFFLFRYSYLAQRGMAWGFGMAERLDLALAFLIEGRKDFEQPECVLGSAANKFVPVKAALGEGELFNSDQEVADFA